MAEWSNAADSKSVIGFFPIWGSNPHLSANSFFRGDENSRAGVDCEAVEQQTPPGGPNKVRMSKANNPHLSAD